MGKKNSKPLDNSVADLIFRSESIGYWLRESRLQRGLSLRELEALSGVSNSEISKVESWRQDCRFESFVRLCAALGIPPGRILDDSSFSNVGVFHRCLLADPDFNAIVTELRADKYREPLALNLASACTFAAILLRCSCALRRASAATYPNVEMKSAYAAFAARLDAADDHLERSGIIDALLSHPISELRNQGLISRPWLTALAQPKKVRPTVWTPYVYARTPKTV